MTVERSNLFPVDTRVVLQTLVEKVHDLVEDRLVKEEPPEAILPVLDSKEQLVVATKYPAVDRGLRRAGYFTRVIEVEIFEPAQIFRTVHRQSLHGQMELEACVIARYRVTQRVRLRQRVAIKLEQFVDRHTVLLGTEVGGVGEEKP